MEFFSTILPVVFVVVGIVLVWLVVELAVTVRKARGTIDDLHEQATSTLTSVHAITTSLEPAAEDLKEITASVKPAVDRVDPLVERVSLTVDAANLEIMRLDQILEDVTDITDAAASAVNAVEAATNAPLAVVNTVTDRVRGAFKSRRASEESIALGEQKAAALDEHANPASTLVSEGIDAASRFVGETRSAVESKRAAREAKKAAKAAEANEEAVSETPEAFGPDSASGQAPKHRKVAKEEYFTYVPTDDDGVQR